MTTGASESFHSSHFSNQNNKNEKIQHRRIYCREESLCNQKKHPKTKQTNNNIKPQTFGSLNEHDLTIISFSSQSAQVKGSMNITKHYYLPPSTNAYQLCFIYANRCEKLHFYQWVDYIYCYLQCHFIISFFPPSFSYLHLDYSIFSQNLKCKSIYTFPRLLRILKGILSIMIQIQFLIFSCIVILKWTHFYFYFSSLGFFLLVMDLFK